MAKTRIECTIGNIAEQPFIDAVVNAANARLAPGGGVAGALHDAAGPGLHEECRPLAPIEPGQAVITGAHDLPNRWVVHALGPVYGQDEPAAELLASCYRESLRRADEAGAASIAFPAISTGAFGYPLREGAEVAISAVRETLPELRLIEVVRFVLFGEADLNAFRRAIGDAD